MKDLLVMIIILSFPGANFLNAQPKNNNVSEEKAVMEVVFELFDAYRAGDSSRIRDVFHEKAIFLRVGSKEGQPVLANGSVDGFVKYVGSGLEQLHDEPIWDYQVHIDGNLASVWTKFAFFLGGTFSHCGVDSFQLFKGDNGWKIFFLSDTNQHENCEVPDDIRAKSEKN